MNIFDLGIKDDVFDVVISSGVLHHTKDARRAFAAIVRKAKPGGLVVVGLYNSFGTRADLMRSKLIGVLGREYRLCRAQSDPRQTQGGDLGQGPVLQSARDLASIDEVIGWFARTTSII